MLGIRMLPYVALLLGSLSLTACSAPTDRESAAPTRTITPESSLSSRELDAGGTAAAVDEGGDLLAGAPKDVERPANGSASRPPRLECKARTVEEICGRIGDCALTWEGALSRARAGCAQQRWIRTELFDDCDGYRVAEFRGPDASLTWRRWLRKSYRESARPCSRCTRRAPSAALGAGLVVKRKEHAEPVGAKSATAERRKNCTQIVIFLDWSHDANRITRTPTLHRISDDTYAPYGRGSRAQMPLLLRA